MSKNKANAMRLMSILIFLALILNISCKKSLNNADLKGWNLVIITIDAVDPKKLGCYGGEKNTTPFLDSLAKQGLLIEYAFCPTGSTAPSHASMLTSLFPEHHGCWMNGNSINPKTWNLPATLLSGGYNTIGWTRAFLMSRKENFDRGFKHFYFRPYSKLYEDYPNKDSNLNDYEQARAFFNSANVSFPFFAWFHIKGGHYPLVPIDSKYLKRHNITSSSEHLPAMPENLEPNLAYLSSDSPINNDDQYLNKLRKYYESNLSEMDDALRLLIGLFRSDEKYNNSLFVIVADHGETYENGIIGQHAPSPYDSTMRIPLIFWTPNRNIKGGEKIKDRIVSIADIAPTVLKLLGKKDEYPSGLDGMDIFDKSNKRYTLQGSYGGIYLYEYELAKWKECQIGKENAREGCQSYWNIAVKTESEQWMYYLQYRYDRMSKLILKLIYTQAGAYKYRIPNKIQLYDLTFDPGERVDLLTKGNDFSDIAQDMFLELRRTRPLAGWATDLINNPIDLPDLAIRTEFSSRQWKLDEVTIERLKSIGYLR